MDYPLNALGLSHQFMASHVQEGALCIDGTAGRGRDTLFLSNLVGPSGKVHAFDIQEEAVTSTKKLLEQHNVTWADVHLENHCHIDRYFTPDTIDAIMFNFGWLPGGNHHVFSHGDTSVQAIEKGLTLLKPGGVMSLCIYYGRESGYEERDTLLTYLKTIDQKRFSVLLGNFINRTNEPPMVVFIFKDRI